MKENGEKIESNSRERREYKRVKTEYISQFEVLDSPDDINPAGKMKIQNISTGGMLIEGDEPLKIGTIIKLDLFIKKRKKLHRFMCRVVRIEEILINKLFEIGVAFINLSEEQKVIVKELVN